MSLRVMDRVWADFPGGGSDLLTLLAMADWSDDDGRCWPSIAAIAKKTRLSRSQTQRTVHGLIDAGYVAVTGNETGGAPGSTRQYRIVLSKLTGRANATPTGSAHATGSVGATGSTHAQEGSHGCAQTGSAHATQTVSEPSIHVREPSSVEEGCAQASPDHLPACPHQAIISLYGKHLPTLPQPRTWEGQRANNLKARWRWVLTAKKRGSGERYAVDAVGATAFFERFFAYVANSDFLTGRDGKWQGCDLPWLVKAENFAKVIEGKYENRGAE